MPRAPDLPTSLAELASRQALRIRAESFDRDAIYLAETVSRILSGAAIQVLQHHRDVNAVAFSPDGRLLATGSDDYMAQVWEVASGRERSRITHHDWVRGVAFSPDGRQLATASYDHTARIWELPESQ